jgi:maltose O-acetyltransferase
MHRLKLVLYYALIQHLPHSRLSSLSNRIRVWYLSHVLGVMPDDCNSKFEPCVYISDARRLRVGRHVRINENAFLQGAIVIGDFVMIAPKVSIYTRTHRHEDAGRPMVLAGETETRPVTIEDDVWIGINAVVLPGITIGRGSIVGANSLVNKNVEPYSIVGGVPARLIRRRM